MYIISRFLSCGLGNARPGKGKDGLLLRPLSDMFNLFDWRSSAGLKDSRRPAIGNLESAWTRTNAWHAGAHHAVVYTASNGVARSVPCLSCTPATRALGEATRACLREYVSRLDKHHRDIMKVWSDLMTRRYPLASMKAAVRQYDSQLVRMR